MPASKTSRRKGKGPKTLTKKKGVTKYRIDCSRPVDDEIMSLADFEKHFLTKIKVYSQKGNDFTRGKAGQLGNEVSVKTDEASRSVTVTVANHVRFKKSYLKYLTKKFLKKNGLRDYLRCIAHEKFRTDYTLKYFQIDAGEDDGEEDESSESE